jgi:NAD(P)-dependent dehydrogenase (short-subunit alcohol dehydrogenase family)
MSNAVLTTGRTAVVTGAAGGIGLEACKRFASLGMRVCLADLPGAALDAAGVEVAGLAQNGGRDVLSVATDVGVRAEIDFLKDAVFAEFGEVGLLMNNAATRRGGGPLADTENWRHTMEVNLFGAIDGVQAFVPAMIAQETPCMVVNTGSKQGITNPPGNTAYNVSKAALTAYTEGLQHELRSRPDCRVTAHLLVPGCTTTGGRPHQRGAWLPRQVIDFLVPALERGDFYIICPDDDVTPAMDRKRILWAAGDIVDNRPALSRWHPEFAAEFEKFTT